MRIIFGWHLDGASYPEIAAPEHDGLKQASLGSVVCGPAGLIGWLETRLGLGLPPVSSALRIAHWLRKMSGIDDDKKSWSASAKADGWATARLLLGWRDTLVEAGWDGRTIGLRRLDELADLEAADPVLPSGPADRLRAVIAALAVEDKPPLSAITLQTPMAVLPPAWRQLLEALDKLGVTIIDAPAAPLSSASIIALTAKSESQAAEAVAGWLAAHALDNRDADGLVLLVADGAPVLDEACHHLGLPRPGGGGSSPWRAVRQFLPIALSTAFRPFDPARLVELLLLPISPVPRGVANILVSALTEEPGIGPRWAGALKEAAGPSAERTGWEGWLKPARFDAETGIPAEEIIALCRRYQAWAHYRIEWGQTNAPPPGDTLLPMAAAEAAALAETVESSGLALIPRRQLERMLDSVVADGIALPDGGAEAAPWSVIDHPGRLWAGANTIIWHGFTATSAGLPALPPWQAGERKALADRGCLLDDPALALQRTVAAWRAPVSHARRLVLVMPETTAGVPIQPHPLWHELKEVPQQTAADWLAGEMPLLGLQPNRQPASPAIRPVPIRKWTLPPNLVVPRASESATSLQTLMGCGLAWVLEYSAKLKAGALTELPAGSRLVGLLAHAVIARLFAERLDWPPEAAGIRSATLLEELVPQMAASLLLPGQAMMHERAVANIKASIVQLMTLIGQAGLRVAGCEMPVTGRLAVDGPDITGRLDLLLQDSKGRSIVLDLKWANKADYRREELASDKAIQLAVYAATQSDCEGAGYYMLAQRRLLFSTQAPFPEACHVSGSNLARIARNLADGFTSRMSDFADGNIIAAGVEGEDVSLPMPLTIDPPCKFCAHSRICGQERVA